jgi:hypothetical protein
MRSIFSRNHASRHRGARLSHHHPVRDQIPSQRPMENRVRLGARAIQRIRHANRNHRTRRQSHRPHHRWGRRRRRSDHLHRLGGRSSRGWGRRGRRRRSSLSHFLMPPFSYWRGWGHLRRARRRNHQIIDDGPYPINRRTIGSRQRPGCVVVYFAIQRSHPIGHAHLNILSRQRGLGRDLSLNVAANLLIVSRGRGCWLRGCSGSGRRGLFRRLGTLATRPQHQQTRQNRQRYAASA